MNWQQSINIYAGFTIGPSDVCQYIPTSDSLVLADPDHHESAYFKINGLRSDNDCRISENKPAKN